jgi:XTP/dITP diphosphohydrolase
MTPLVRLLIATTNQGKIAEIKHVFEHQAIECVFLNDLPNCPPPPDESGDTFVQNAILKATYYAEKTGLLTLADDAGLCIDALGGWPGVQSARVANSSEERMALVIEKMQGKVGRERSAAFRIAMALYDPQRKTLFIAEGEDTGHIADAQQGNRGFGYDPIFVSDVTGESYGSMTIQQKNAISHRAKALDKIKYYIKNNYGAKHAVVPLAIIVREGKILMNLRNDPHNPEFHNVWELPGGSVEWGEAVEESLIREVAEEAGYAVNIVQQLSGVFINTVHQQATNVRYQVYLIPYVCQIMSGTGLSQATEEVIESRWFDISDVLKERLLADNKEIFTTLLPELTKTITTHHL